ncbi:MAG: transposon-encoded TnpW family protein [Defluviitaleaceae bacterium]|nr:transposon-encoded TnpW family protein [Defluviitaleaceae bacterium]
MNLKNPTVKIIKPQEPNRFTKRIGSTTFTVNVYFNPNAKETAQDKIMRLIRNDTSLAKVANL